MTDDLRLDRLEKSVRDLLERIEQLESKTGSSGSVQDTPEPTHPAVHTAGSAADEATPTVPSAASVLANDDVEEASASAPEAESGGAAEESKAAAPPPVMPPIPESRSSGPPIRKTASREHVNLEQLIGTRLVAIVGGLLVALAAAFFAKLAYDSGWIGAIPPIVRALALALAGGALLVVADVLRRRLGKPAAIGLALAGLGTLYVDGWAMDSVLGLVSAEGAIVALALTTLIGLLVTARFGSMLLGGVSLAAGGMAPYVVGGAPSVLAPGLYFTALLASAMGAAIVRPQPFERMRPMALVIVAFFALPWWFMVLAKGETTILLLVSITWWMVMHVTSLVVAVRGHDWRVGASLNLASTALIAIPIPISVSALGGGPNLLAPEGWMVLGFAAVAVAMAFQFGPGLAALSVPPADARRRERCQHRLAGTAWLEAGVLVMLAAALLLRGVALPVAWVGIALAVVVHASRQGQRRAAIFGGVAALLALYAGSLMVFQELRGGMGLRGGIGSWLSRTPFQFASVPELWIVLVTGLGVLATALWWPAPPEGRRTSRGPSTLLVIGVPAWLFPATLLGAAGWWCAILIVPIWAAVLVSRRRADRAARRFGITWATLAFIPLTAALVIPVFGTLGGVRGLTADANGALNLMQEWGGSTATMLSLLAVQAAFLAGIVRLGPGPALEDGNARAWGSSQLLSVAVVPLGAALVLSLVSSTRVGWSVWVGPPMVGATGAAAILAALVLLHRARVVSAAVRLVMALSAAVGVVWIGAAVASGLAPDLMPTELPPIVNVRGFTGVGIIVILGGTLWATRGLGSTVVHEIPAVLVAVGLTLGSVLIQDIAGRGTLAADSGISIWWAIYAIALIVAGFRFDSAVLRKIGLLLLAVTSIKFLLMDLRNAETIHRIVSALGVGLLMVLTSVIYVRAGRGESDGSIEENGSGLS